MIPSLSATVYAVYLVASSVFVIAENRRPQATFAWVFLFILLPGAGLVIYLLFGRDFRTAAPPPRRMRRLRRQNFARGPAPLQALIDAEDEALKDLEAHPGPQGRLAQLVRYNAHSGLTTENRVEILQDATETYPRLIEDIRNAKHSIHLQFFIWASDAVGQEMKPILLAKAAEGVKVRLLYDPLGSLWRLDPRYRWELQRGGIEVAPYSRLWKLHTISYRNHRKIAIIDNIIGYTGGLNIGQEQVDGGSAFKAWRDTHVRFVGTAAVILQAVFAVDWQNAVGEDLFKPEYFPPVPDTTSNEDVPVQITVSGPDSRWRAIRQLYFALINSAREHVYIQSPFFILDETIAEALKASALAGVDVQIMLGERAAVNNLPHWAGNTYIAEVAAAGAKIFLYRHDHYFHPKTISIDSEICSIGSANMDIRSFSINYELNAVIYDRDTACALEDAFRRDLEHCHPFDLEAYQRSRSLTRFRDSVARLFSPLL
jgi:cardiolipin synthase